MNEMKKNQIIICLLTCIFLIDACNYDEPRNMTETKEENTIEYDVIFTTAYNHFAIKAFKYATIDYLLKPIDIDELIAATEKAEKQKGKLGVNEKIQMLMT